MVSKAHIKESEKHHRLKRPDTSLSGHVGASHNVSNHTGSFAFTNVAFNFTISETSSREGPSATFDFDATYHVCMSTLHSAHFIQHRATMRLISMHLDAPFLRLPNTPLLSIHNSIMLSRMASSKGLEQQHHSKHLLHANLVVTTCL